MKGREKELYSFIARAFSFCLFLVLYCTGARLHTAGSQILPRLVAENKNICQICFCNSNLDSGNAFVPLSPVYFQVTVLHCPPHRSLAHNEILQAARQSILYGPVLATVSVPKDLSSSQRPDAGFMEGSLTSLSWLPSPVIALSTQVSFKQKLI